MKVAKNLLMEGQGVQPGRECLWQVTVQTSRGGWTLPWPGEQAELTVTLLD